ncbi:hypothetical protein Tco_0748677 [Tanacetum coccineum]|uniref:Uncharacterized protein n=1 Tax=Tanacetum coccineum TaxID=301880 RepID=A0ABQ4YXG2_9ASTR
MDEMKDLGEDSTINDKPNSGASIPVKSTTDGPEIKETSVGPKPSDTPDGANRAMTANIPEEVGTQSIAQLTRVVTDGVRVFVPRVIANGGDSFGSQMLVNGVADNIGGLVSQGSGLMANGVSESVPPGVVNGVGVDGGVVNGVGVNGVRGNGVSEGMINGARAGGVRRSFREFVSEFLADGSSSSVGQVVDVSATEIDKDHLLACFNQEVREDLARLRVYRSLANGLRVAVRRRL